MGLIIGLGKSAGKAGESSYVVAWDGASTPVVAGIPAGVVVTYNGTSYTGTLAASKDKAGKIFLVSDGTGNEYYRYVVSRNGDVYSWVSLGSTEIDLSGYATEDDLAALGRKVVYVSLGKNLFFLQDLATGENLDSTGGVASGGSVRRYTKNYIPVEAETAYIFSTDGVEKRVGESYMYHCFYDEHFNFISSVAANNSRFTTPSGAKYVRLSLRETYYGDTTQLEKGTAVTLFSYVSPIFGYLQSDQEPTIGSDKFVLSGGVRTFLDREYVKIGCKNIYDGVISPGFFNGNGVVQSSTITYHTDNYLPVKPNTGYCATKAGGGAISGAGSFLVFYDYGKRFIDSIKFADMTDGIKFTTPAGCYYIRTSLRPDYANIQIEEGNSRTDYVKYNPIHDYIAYFENALSQVSSMVGGDSGNISASSLSANSSITLPDFPKRLKKRLAISFFGKFSSFDSLSIGQNYKADSGAGIKIDGTNVYAMTYSSGAESVEQTIAHGISSFADYISVSLYIDSAQCGYVTIATSTGTARIKLDQYYFAHFGAIFANASMAMTSVKLNADCSDFRSSVWAFGDSYFGLSDVRVGYWLRENGFFNMLFDGVAGENATGALSELKNCLVFGSPKYIVWAIGMNSAADSAGQPDATWLSKTQELIGICDSLGATPILCTIPSVPGRVHEALSSWVRSSGHRYIDLANAVGAQADGTWYDGMLSNDGVHPTQLGAKVLAQRWLADFPELMQYGIVDPSGENSLITI